MKYFKIFSPFCMCFTSQSFDYTIDVQIVKDNFNRTSKTTFRLVKVRFD